MLAVRSRTRRGNRLGRSVRAGHDIGIKDLASGFPRDKNLTPGRADEVRNHGAGIEIPFRDAFGRGWRAAPAPTVEDPRIWLGPGSLRGLSNAYFKSRGFSVSTGIKGNQFHRSKGCPVFRASSAGTR